MRWLIILGLMFGLSGCITLSDVSTGVGAVGATALADTVAPGLGTGAKVIVTAVGATAGAALVEDTVQTVTKETLTAVTNPWQGMVLAFQTLLNHAFELVVAISIGVFAIPMLLTFALGKIMPRKKEKVVRAENEVLKKLMMDQEK